MVEPPAKASCPCLPHRTMPAPRGVRHLGPRALVVLLASIFAGPAKACCTDLWSCSVAVASAGASCVFEAALKAVHELTALILREQDRARRGVEDAANRDAGAAQDVANQWQRRAESAGDETARAAARAAQLVGEDTARRRAALDAVTQPQAQPQAQRPAPGLTRHERVGGVSRPIERSPNLGLPPEPSMTELHQRIVALDREVQGLRRANAEQADQARAAIRHAHTEFVAAHLAKVGTAFAAVLGRFALAQNNTDVGKVLALAADALAVGTFVQQLVLQVERDLAHDAAPFANRLQTAADAPRETASQAEQRAQRARELLVMLERLARVHSLQDREQQARAMLAAAPGSGPRNLDSIRPTLTASAAIAGGMRQQLNLVQGEILRLPGLAQRPDVTPFRARIHQDLQSRFRDQPPADQARQREQLLAEARQRLAGQPQWLPGVEALIREAGTAPPGSR